MRKLIYSMSVSLDGYIAGPDGGFDWSVPDEELHRFHNERVRSLETHLLGRRLYETMLVWETWDEAHFENDYQREFARIWKELPRVVFSRTLDKVEGNARLAKRDAVEEVAELKEQPGGDIGVGGATLAASLTRAGLIDEYGLFISPVTVGGGIPFFGDFTQRIDLELVETRIFSDRVVYLRYRTLR
jgi:dihydrofolate reductase